MATTITIDTANKKAPDAFAGSAALDLEQFDVTLDNSYPTGGYELAASDFALQGGFRILDFSVVNGTVRHYCEWDAANGKLVVKDTAGVEIPNGTNLAAFSGRAELLRY